VVQVSDGTSSDSSAEVAHAVRPQVFYYSPKMFQYLCENGTPDRIAQAALRKVENCHGVLKKRRESQLRAGKLREYVQDHNLSKPSGPELARLRRKRASTAKNTAGVMPNTKPQP
jgi:hypothetical protein